MAVFDKTFWFGRGIEMGKKFGFPFFCKRAEGFSVATSKIPRQLGIPFTRSGRQRKVGRAMGCCVILFFMVAMATSTMMGVPNVFAEEIVITKEGKEILLRDDKTWENVIGSSTDIKYAEEAVEIWDKSLTLRESEYGSNFVALQLHYKNNTNTKIIGITAFVSIKNPFGKVVLENTYEDVVAVEPDEKLRNNTYWKYEDNQFINGQPFDLMWQMAQHGTAKIETKVLKVVFADGTLLESKLKIKRPSAKKK